MIYGVNCMDKLIISRPIVCNNCDKSRLCFKITHKGNIYEAYYEVDSIYKDYLCDERSDGLVVNLLLYAMEHNLNIECEQVMSDKLYYQLTEYLIPLISKHIKKYHKINIISELTSEPLKVNNYAVGASLSCGVDSFYTLLRHLNKKENNYNITHLCFFNAGASGANGGGKARLRYLERIDYIKTCSQKLNLPMVCVDTNINEYLAQGHEATHTFRTLAIPLILQKLFNKYYFASGFDVSRFCFSPTDTAKYDLLITQCISNNMVRFYLSGGEVSRIEKVKYISDYDITYDYLNVCTSEISNCCKCDKCRRTILELYALKKLDCYNKIFDIQYFYNHKHLFFAQMIGLGLWQERDDKEDWIDIYKIIKKEISFKDYLFGVMVLIYRIARRKLYKINLIKKIYNKFIAK